MRACGSASWRLKRSRTRLATFVRASPSTACLEVSNARRARRKVWSRPGSRRRRSRARSYRARRRSLSQSWSMENSKYPSHSVTAPGTSVTARSNRGPTISPRAFFFPLASATSAGSTRATGFRSARTIQRKPRARASRAFPELRGAELADQRDVRVVPRAGVRHDPLEFHDAVHRGLVRHVELGVDRRRRVDRIVRVRSSSSSPSAATARAAASSIGSSSAGSAPRARFGGMPAMLGPGRAPREWRAPQISSSSVEAADRAFSRLPDIQTSTRNVSPFPRRRAARRFARAGAERVTRFRDSSTPTHVVLYIIATNTKAHGARITRGRVPLRTTRRANRSSSPRGNFSGRLASAARPPSRPPFRPRRPASRPPRGRSPPPPRSRRVRVGAHRADQHGHAAQTHQLLRRRAQRDASRVRALRHAPQRFGARRLHALAAWMRRRLAPSTAATPALAISSHRAFVPGASNERSSPRSACDKTVSVSNAVASASPPRRRPTLAAPARSSSNSSSISCSLCRHATRSRAA